MVCLKFLFLARSYKAKEWNQTLISLAYLVLEHIQAFGLKDKKAMSVFDKDTLLHLKERIYVCISWNQHWVGSSCLITGLKKTVATNSKICGPSCSKEKHKIPWTSTFRCQHHQCLPKNLNSFYNPGTVTASDRCVHVVIYCSELLTEVRKRA